MKSNKPFAVLSVRNKVRFVSLVCVLVGAGGVSAQFADWTTAGFDAQRSNWQRSDTKISLEAMRKPGFELVWKNSVNEGKGQERLTTPVLLDFYISFRGFRSLAFVGGSGNSVIAFDADLGRLEWRKDFKVDGAQPAPTALCPGGMTAGLTRPAIVGYPPPSGTGGAGRGSPGKSGVGEPFEGAVTIRREPPPRPPAAPSPAEAKVAAANTVRRVAVAQSLYAPRVQLVYALTSDGKLHALYVSNGEEPKPAVQFIPANSYAKGLLVVDNVAYVATTNGCGGTENGIWALDLATQKVSHWKSDSGIGGTTGLAAGPDGTIYTTAGAEVAALDARTLARKNSYNVGKTVFTSSPLLIDSGGKDLIAAASSDGKLHVLDSATNGASLATSPAFSTSEAPIGDLASWTDSTGVRWILAATYAAPTAGSGLNASNGAVTDGAIVAWKLVDRGGKPTWEPGWTSRNMLAPAGPIVVNGVIFALATGEYRPKDAKVATSERSRRSTPAILYALDSATGKELWNSGKTITSHVSAAGLAAGGSRVYVAAQDGTQYVFGFPMEH